MDKTFIYALHDPRDWSIRYVGKANKPQRRHNKPRSHNRMLQNFLNELRSLGLKPRVSILQQCSPDQWQNWERFWIATVKAAGEKLLNLHLGGGEGPITPRAWNKGLKMSEEYCSKLPYRGKKLSEEHRARISESRKGKKDSPEARMNKSLAAKGKPKSPEHAAKAAEAQRGRKFSLGHREKLRIAKLGTKHSPESIAKYAATIREKWNDPKYRERVSAGLRESWRKRLEEV